MSDTPLPLHTSHPRSYRENKFVYPVLSRRSRGISIGVNLNPDKVCNFDCIYCQVDRRSEVETRFVEFDQLLSELDDMFRFVTSGEIYDDEMFRDVPAELQRLNRSEEHTSELQSRRNLVCRLLLERKKTK